MSRTILRMLILLPFTALLVACMNTPNPEQTMKAPLIPLKNFFKNSDKTNYQISPDGKYLSYLAPVNSRMNVFVQAVGGKEAKQITFETSRDIAGYYWANENRILFLKDAGGDENYKLFGVNLDGSNPKGLTDFEGVMTQLIDELPEQSDFVIVGLNKRNPEIFDPYRLNIVTGELTMLAENPGNIQSWVTDHDGKLRVAVVTDGVNNSLMYRETEEQVFKTVLTTNFKSSVEPLFFTFDNQNLYVISNLNRDKSAAVILDLKTGQEKEILFSHPEVDIQSISYSRLNKKLISAIYVTEKTQRHYFDKDTEQRHNWIKTQLPNMEFSVVDITKNEDIAIIRTHTDKSLGSFYLYNSKTPSLEKITDVAPWIDENQMAEMKPISYQSRDGLTIHGYLTLPKGIDAKNLPVVINPHGGPWHRDQWGYNPEVQFLANRGYAVLQMNFRGSTGYGKAFWEASFKQWGQNMQNDITDGVKWLIEQGIADSTRIAIYGASYGGYATLSGVAFTPELYACAIDYVGVSNLFTFMETIPPYWKPFLDMMHEMVGDPSIEKDSLMLRASSPVFHVDKIKAPLFIAQGANDPRVKKSESDQMVEALKKKGVEVQYLVKDNEGHGFRNEENKFEFYETMEKFLELHLANSNK